MTNAKPTKNKLDGCVVAIFVACFAIVLVPLALYFVLTWSSGYWSISARSEIRDQPCSLILMFDGDPERIVRVDAVRTESSYGKYILKERGSATLRSVTVIAGDREKTTVFDLRISAGSNVSLTVYGDLDVRESIDYDHHM